MFIASEVASRGVLDLCDLTGTINLHLNRGVQGASRFVSFESHNLSRSSEEL